MTYHDNNTPDLKANARPQGHNPGRSGIVWMLGLVALLILGGLMLMTRGDDETVVTRTDRPAATTGSGATTTAPAARDELPNSKAVPGVTPSTVPSPTRQ